MTSSEYGIVAKGDVPTDARPTPAPSQASNPYAPTAWGQYDQELRVGSGQLCREKKLDFVELMGSGLLDKLNTLSGVVDKHVKKGEGAPPIDPMKMMTDKRTAKQMAELISQVVCMVVTAPPIVMTPEKFEDRVDGVVYVDTVGITDKMEIFTYAMGGLTELESFRGGSDSAA
jgi:hypothetical protein